MIFEGQNDRKVRGDKCAVSNGKDHVLEQNVGAHRFAVSDDRFFFFRLAVPTVQLDATTAGQQCLPIHFDRTFAAKLTTGQVRVVRRTVHQFSESGETNTKTN